MLRFGLTAPVRRFIEWYAPFQYPDGKVPCCVGKRGGDPVPEHDSHGQLIFAIAEYVRHTRDLDLARSMWPHVTAAVGYIDALRHQRMTDAYRTPEKRAFYGLMPESISHEGYSAKPMHSYWDQLFGLKGLEDASWLARQLGVEHAAIDAGFEEFELIACRRHSQSRERVLTREDSERTAAILSTLRDAGHLLALLTGNLESIGRHKMELAGLGEFFPAGQGAFGSDAEHRPDLVPIARERASVNGRPHPADDTVVIGDTPLDVAAAIAGGVLSIGVGGFRYTREDLLEAGADHAVDELDEIPAALERLTPR
jgi:phosphoglycolate phosphatase-like HAD superfamily hydrolase